MAGDLKTRIQRLQRDKESFEAHFGLKTVDQIVLQPAFDTVTTLLVWLAKAPVQLEDCQSGLLQCLQYIVNNAVPTNKALQYFLLYRSLELLMSPDEVPSVQLHELMGQIHEKYRTDALLAFAADYRITDDSLKRLGQRLCSHKVIRYSADFMDDLVYSLRIARRFSALVEITTACVPQLMAILVETTKIKRQLSLLAIVEVLLVGYRAEAVVFHRCIAPFLALFDKIKAEKNPEIAELYENLCSSVQCLLAMHPGYPRLYAPLWNKMEGFDFLTRRQIDEKVREQYWPISSSAGSSSSRYAWPEGHYFANPFDQMRFKVNNAFNGYFVEGTRLDGARLEGILQRSPTWKSSEIDGYEFHGHLDAPQDKVKQKYFKTTIDRDFRTMSGTSFESDAQYNLNGIRVDQVSKFDALPQEVDDEKGSTLEYFEGRWHVMFKCDGENNVIRSHNAACIVNNQLWIFFGLQFPPVASNQINVFNLGDKTWETIVSSSPETQKSPLAREGAPGVTCGDNNFWIFGGLTSRDFVNDLWYFNFTTREWMEVVTQGPLPCGRHAHKMVYECGSLWVFGGSARRFPLELEIEVTKIDDCLGEVDPPLAPTPPKYAPRDLLNDLWCFDPRIKHWKPLYHESLMCPGPRCEHVMVGHKNMLWVFGGGSGPPSFGGVIAGEVLNDFWVYDIEGNSWKEIECEGLKPAPRRGACSTVCDGMLWIFGGIDQQCHFMKDLWCFNFETHMWTHVVPKGAVPHARAFTSLCSVTNGKGDDMLVLHGTDVLIFQFEQRTDPEQDLVEAMHFGGGHGGPLSPIPGSVLFDEIEQFSFDGTKAFAMEFWVRVDMDENSYFPQTIASKGERVQNHSGNLGFNGHWALSFNKDGSLDFERPSRPFHHRLEGTFSADTDFHHVACTSDGSTHTFFIDGRECETKYFFPVSKNGATRLRIGSIGGMGQDIQPMNGVILEARIWNRSLSHQDILTNKDRTLTGYEDGLIGYWSLFRRRSLQDCHLSGAFNLALGTPNGSSPCDGKVMAGVSWLILREEELPFTISKPLSTPHLFLCGGAHISSIGELVLVDAKNTIPSCAWYRHEVAVGRGFETDIEFCIEPCTRDRAGFAVVIQGGSRLQRQSIPKTYATMFEDLDNSVIVTVTWKDRGKKMEIGLLYNSANRTSENIGEPVLVNAISEGTLKIRYEGYTSKLVCDLSSNHQVKRIHGELERNVNIAGRLSLSQQERARQDRSQMIHGGKYAWMGLAALQMSNLKIISWKYAEVDSVVGYLTKVSTHDNDVCDMAIERSCGDLNQSWSLIMDNASNLEDMCERFKKEKMHRKLEMQKKSLDGQWNMNRLGSINIKTADEVQGYNLSIGYGLDHQGKIEGMVFRRPEDKEWRFIGAWTNKHVYQFRPCVMTFDENFMKFHGIWYSGANQDNFHGEKSEFYELPQQPGLQNLGNSCYMNSFLQSLFLTRPLRELVLKGSFPYNKDEPGPAKTVHFLQNVFTRLQLSQRSFLEPKQFKDSLGGIWKSPGQQDSSEFGSYLIDQCEMGLLDSSSLDPYSLFRGSLETVIQCSVCGVLSARKEEFSNLSIHFPQDYAPISDIIIVQERKSQSSSNNSANPTGDGLDKDNSLGSRVPPGYHKIFVDLNPGHGASMYICHSRSPEYKPITDIIVMYGETGDVMVDHDENMSISGPIPPTPPPPVIKPEAPPGYHLIDVDINIRADGKQRGPPTYLCFTRTEGSPITDLNIITGTDSVTPPEGYDKIPENVNPSSSTMMDMDEKMVDSVVDDNEVSVFLAVTRTGCPIVDIQVVTGSRAVCPPTGFEKIDVDLCIPQNGYQVVDSGKGKHAYVCYKRGQSHPIVSVDVAHSREDATKLTNIGYKIVPLEIYKKDGVTGVIHQPFLCYKRSNGCPISKIDVFRGCKQPPKYGDVSTLNVVPEIEPPPGVRGIWSITNCPGQRFEFTQMSDEILLYPIHGSYNISGNINGHAYQHPTRRIWECPGTFCHRQMQGFCKLEWQQSGTDCTMNGSYVAGSSIGCWGCIKVKELPPETDKYRIDIVDVGVLSVAAAHEVRIIAPEVYDKNNESHRFAVDRIQEESSFKIRTSDGVLSILHESMPKIVSHGGDDSPFLTNMYFHGSDDDGYVIRSSLGGVLAVDGKGLLVHQTDDESEAPPVKFKFSKIKARPPSEVDQITGSYSSNNDDFNVLLRAQEARKGRLVSGVIGNHQGHVEGVLYLNSNDRWTFEGKYEEEREKKPKAVTLEFSQNLCEVNGHSIERDQVTNVWVGRRDNYLCISTWKDYSQQWEDGKQICSGAAAGEDLDSLLRHYMCPQIMDGVNKYSCKGCKQKQRAEQFIRISNSPQHLFITLKRFAFDLRTLQRSKIFKQVDIPATLELPCQNSDEDKSLDEADEKCEQPSSSHHGRIPSITRHRAFLRPQNIVRYGLYGVVVHSGKSADVGHYYCFGRDSALPDLCKEESQFEDWHKFDDQNVTRATFEQITEIQNTLPMDSAYLLFYKRLNPADDEDVYNPHNSSDSRNSHSMISPPTSPPMVPTQARTSIFSPMSPAFSSPPSSPELKPLDMSISNTPPVPPRPPTRHRIPPPDIHLNNPFGRDIEDIDAKVDSQKLKSFIFSTSLQVQSSVASEIGVDNRRIYTNELQYQNSYLRNKYLRETVSGALNLSDNLYDRYGAPQQTTIDYNSKCNAARISSNIKYNPNTISCSYCHQHVPRSFLNSHLLDKCPRRNVLCKFCGQQMQADTLEKHFADCRYREWSATFCRACKSVFAYSEFHEHVKTCFDNFLREKQLEAKRQEQKRLEEAKKVTVEEPMDVDMAIEGKAINPPGPPAGGPPGLPAPEPPPIPSPPPRVEVVEAPQKCPLCPREFTDQRELEVHASSCGE